MTLKKARPIIQVKEIKLKPKTEEHDVQVKLKHIKKFLKDHDKVKSIHDVQRT